MSTHIKQLMHKNKYRIILSILCIPVCDQNVYLHVWASVSAGYEELSPEEEITLHHFIFSKEKGSFEGLWGNRIMTRFALNHSLPQAFYESLASKGTRPLYSRRDGQNIFIIEINFWWDGRDQSCKVAVHPPGFLDTISDFPTADGILLFDSFVTENWEDLYVSII